MAVRRSGLSAVESRRPGGDGAAAGERLLRAAARAALDAAASERDLGGIGGAKAKQRNEREGRNG